ncbi:glyoxylase I 4-like [Silene latifolia]|uniref:glyoxylase I 4-like n=1 Tax=Silene latifolia TaxID=37657 RepID=UPI003D77F7BD
MGSLGYGEIEEETMWASSVSVNSGALPLLSLNHVSYVCKSLADSVTFYVDVLGFGLIKRPSSFQFEGAWLFNYGIGIHLLESNNHQRRTTKINPKENHISFQCSDMNLVIKKLEVMGIEYVTAQVEEGGIKVDQLFFHDPDGYMVEICNCDNIPILPLSSCPLKIPKATTPTPKVYANHGSSEFHCSSEKLESQMMESLMMGMMNIGF